VKHELKDEKNKNISMGIQFKPTKKDVDDPDGLDVDAQKLLRYVNFNGMFQKY
jgi:hypothetical protein